jgi:hypothetical protein
VTTDDEADGATNSDPVETTLTFPNAGTVTIVETPVSAAPPPGFTFLGYEVVITAPAATAADPIVILFRLDASIVPPGEDETTIQTFRNGTPVPPCTGPAGVASPDPCVSDRGLAGDGDVELTVLTSSASYWDFGIEVAGTSTTTSISTTSTTTTTIAAGSPISGKKLAIHIRSDMPAKNRVLHLSKDPGLFAPQNVDEDPRCPPTGSGGGMVRVTGPGGDVAIELPCANWSLKSRHNEFAYRDRSGTTCKAVRIREGRLQAVCAGAHVAYSLGIPQSTVDVVVSTGNAATGRRYCASYGPATAADVVKDGSDGKKYQARDATAPAECP